MNKKWQTLYNIHDAPSDDCLPTLLLVGYVNDDLSKAEQARVTAHLATCTYCTGEINGLLAAMKRRRPIPVLSEVIKSHWQMTTEGWKRLTTTLDIGIARMSARFQQLDPAFQLRPATVTSTFRNSEASGHSWSLTIPEEPGLTGYAIELTIFSATGKRVDLTIALRGEPDGQPVTGATVTLLHKLNSPESKVTDAKGVVTWQLAPDSYEIAIRDKDVERRLPLAIREEKP